MKKYSFYGCDSSDITGAFGLTPRNCYDLLSELWCAETCAPRMRREWTKENKTLGQCSITAFLMQDVFGGKVYGVPLEDGNFHCFNAAGGYVFDLTSEQFGGKALRYDGCPEQLRLTHFASGEKRQRYEYLRDRFLKAAKGREAVAKTLSFVKEKFSSGYLAEHPDEQSYRLEHTLRVANIGREIARREGFDESELMIACLLHDVSYCEAFGEDGWIEHGRRSAQISRPFLETLGFSSDRIGDICYGIAIHVDDKADFQGEQTAFALSVGDADNIDRFDVYRIHETLNYDRFLEMRLEEKADYVLQKLAKLRARIDMPMGTQTAKQMWKERLSFYISFYERLADQLEHSAGIV